MPSRRRFSLGGHLSIPQSIVGKINSLEHFASSYSRAQSFLGIDPPTDLDRARTFYIDQNDTAVAGDEEQQQRLAALPSGSREEDLLESWRRPSTGGGSRRQSFAPVFEEDSSGGEAETERALNEFSGLLHHHAGSELHRRRPSFLPLPAQGATILREAEALPTEGVDAEPLILREIEDKNGQITTTVAGQSTAPQTVFNSVNVLVGIGMLSLSLGFSYTGWVLGLVFFIGSALVTYYSARLLAKCMDTDPALVTYADIAYAAYGPRGRAVTSMLFTVELTGAGVSMIILFADSLNALFPQFTTSQYKVLSFFILTPLCFLPLSILSISSILGITSTLGLVLIILIDGLVKPSAPGSLLSPMPSGLWPRNWMTVPLSIGIFMSPWGGHAVFPNIYRDMRHPSKYGSCLTTTYYVTFLIDICTAILGFLMFGVEVSDEVSKSILLTQGYPASLGLLMTALIAIIPIAKSPLSVRPIVSTLDALFNLNELPEDAAIPRKVNWKKLARYTLRPIVVGLNVYFSIIYPSFDRIIGLLGSTMITTICVVGPITFFHKLYYGRIPKYQFWINNLLMFIFSIIGVVGTVWCFLPEEIVAKGFIA
jgi:vesicular inhibitory amino acid transporter